MVPGCAKPHCHSPHPPDSGVASAQLEDPLNCPSSLKSAGYSRARQAPATVVYQTLTERHCPSRSETGKPLSHFRWPGENSRFRAGTLDRAASIRAIGGGDAHAGRRDYGDGGHMSPEQIRGTPADARSDIFSLGCVLYEMVAGRRAFSRETSAQTMAAILEAQPADIATTGKQVPRSGKSHRALSGEESAAPFPFGTRSRTRFARDAGRFRINAPFPLRWIAAASR